MIREIMVVKFIKIFLHFLRENNFLNGAYFRERFCT